MAASRSGESERKAAEFMQQAKEAENKFSFGGLFGSSASKFEEAAELYAKAANQFKLAKKMKEAGDAYVQAAEAYQKAKSGHEAASNYINASKCYRKVSTKDAVKNLDHAVKYYCDQGRFGIAAKHQQEIGEIYEKDEDTDQAIAAYEAAGEMFEGENSVSAASKCFVKVADMTAQQEDYDRAVKLYEKLAEAALPNSLLQWGCKEYFFKAALCTMATGDFVRARSQVEKYINLDNKFATSREGKFVVVLVKACEEMDVKSFTNAIVEYDAITSLDAWKTSVLLKAKNHLKESTDGIL